MRSLPLAAIAAVALTVLAGCASHPNAPASTPETSTDPFVVAHNAAAALHPALGAWQLDCDLGSYEHALNTTWPQQCVARASHTPGSKEEMWTAVNPTNPLNVVIGSKDLNQANSPGCVWNGLGVTHDGGKTWKDVVIGGAYADRAPTSPFFGYRCNTDPDFRFTSDGALHYGVEMYDLGSSADMPADISKTADSGYKILLATSHDGGDTFPEVITYQPDIVVVTDFSRMAVSPKTGTVLEAIGSEGGVGCNVLRWTSMVSQAATFEPVATKDGIPCNSGGGSGVAASPDGTFVLIGAAGVVVRSTDDGVTFADSNPLFGWTGIPGKFKESEYRVTNTVETAYDTSTGPNKGTLYATFAAADRKGDEADIYVRSSKDDGRTWSEPSLVNADPVGTHQWMPNVGVASDGSVHVAFMDKSYDEENNHTFIDMTHAVSVDGGKTWQSERITTRSFDGDLGVHQDGFPFIGDYLGVDCAGSDCWFGFPDSSLGQVPVIAAAHVHHV